MNILSELGLAKESFDNPLDENSAGYIATGEPESETASAAILEATKESAEIDADIDALETVEDATQAIDEQVAVGEVALETNSYTPMLAVIQRVAMKNTLTSVAGRAKATALINNPKYMPAQESFDRCSSRLDYC